MTGCSSNNIEEGTLICRYEIFEDYADNSSLIEIAENYIEHDGKNIDNIYKIDYILGTTAETIEQAKAPWSPSESWQKNDRL